jgi:hypothetical protein
LSGDSSFGRKDKSLRGVCHYIPLKAVIVCHCWSTEHIADCAQ